MAQELDQLPARQALVEIARDFHARGWMAGTAGNLSVRTEEGFWITASGHAKGRLQENDFLLMALENGEVIDTLRSSNKPSAETAIHHTLYTLFPDAGACLHVHSLDACIVSTGIALEAKSLPLPALEILKGFGIWQQNPEVALPLFANHLNVAQIANDIQRRFKKTAPAISALLIRNHGTTVWGKNLQEAYNRVECLEFLLSYQAKITNKTR